MPKARGKAKAKKNQRQLPAASPTAASPARPGSNPMVAASESGLRAADAAATAAAAAVLGGEAEGCEGGSGAHGVTSPNAGAAAVPGAGPPQYRKAENKEPYGEVDYMDRALPPRTMEEAEVVLSSPAAAAPVKKSMKGTPLSPLVRATAGGGGGDADAGWCCCCWCCWS